MHEYFDLSMKLEWKYGGGKWWWKTAFDFEVEKADPLQCHHLVERFESINVVKQIHELGFAALKAELGDRIGLKEFKLDEDNESVMEIPILFEGDDRPLLTSCEYRIYHTDSLDSWVCAVEGLPILGAASTLLQAHQNCEVALKGHVGNLIKKHTRTKVLQGPDQRIGLREIGLQEAVDFLNENPIVFPMLFESPE